MRGKVQLQVSDPAHLERLNAGHTWKAGVWLHTTTAQCGAVPGAGQQLCTAARADWSEHHDKINLKM